MPHPFDASDVLDLPLMAFLGTTEADGAPRTAPVWYLWEDGALWMPGSAGGSSVLRIGRDPRVSVEIVDYDNAGGILKHLGLRGRASVGPMQADRFRRLLARYLGPEDDWNPWFIGEIARIDDPDGRLIRLEPDSLFTNNVSYFRTGPVLATHTSPA
ncbi:pyridoxamine 5'-phosphate oxidase family protein [Sagittula salina]|uniref:Pyridoxamine 5'-phosphate oxidase family protein n=1 Tax=Sagittula salina TaxID=2820268 RepID=A0A940S438_9RHOB|nr:pyridoxamine 5'-phosphate oxidase family protein [Sagittula salina]MBP0483694.1 pyridoxamine 5'-phosphate oxidase family protein [Sagittula salina]